MLFMLFTFAYLHKRNAGYPIGGSMPMSEALDARYRELGGVIHYQQESRQDTHHRRQGYRHQAG